MLVGKTSRADLAQRESRPRCGMGSVVWEGPSWLKCQGLSLKQRQSESQDVVKKVVRFGVV